MSKVEFKILSFLTSRGCTYIRIHVWQMHALRRELSEGLRPLHETFLALVRLFGSEGRATRGLEILAAMEKLNYDIRQAWLLLVGIVYTFLWIGRCFHETQFLFLYGLHLINPVLSIRGTCEKQASRRC